MGFPKSLNVGKAIDRVKGAEREVIGPATHIHSRGNNTAFPKRPGETSVEASGRISTQNTPVLTAPATPEAAQWEGWGTALKPSFEPVLVFRKPLGLQGFSTVIGSHLWKLHARLADLSSTSNPPDSDEELGSAPASVERRSATQVVSSEVTGTSLSDKDLVLSLSIVSSWLDILSALSRHESKFTIEMASSLTTDLRILSYSLSKITPENMPQALILNAGLSCLAEPVARMFDAVVMKLSAILASFAIESATELGLHRPQVEVDRPSWEPVLVFRKPVEGTVAENVLKYGTGGMNIDANRVRHSNPEDFEKHKDMVDRIKEKGGSMADSWKNSSDLSGASEVKTAGRWPPNAVMSHSDGCKKVGTKKVKGITGGKNPHVNPAPITEIGPAFREATNRPYINHADEQTGVTSSGAMSQHGDSGGASRFFPQFEGQAPPEAPFLYTGKANKREATLDGEVENNHPTKKPVALKQWLVRLVTPKKGVCLDPFAGSGSTLVAAVEEGMHFIGIERDPDYHAIAEKRVGDD